MEAQPFLALLVILSIYYVPSIWRAFLNYRKLSSIPTAGPSGFLTSYIGAIRFQRNSRQMLQEECDKCRGPIFKVPTFKSWFIIIHDLRMIDEMRRASDAVLSASEAIKEVLYIHVTVGPEHIEDPFHVETVRGPLTRNIGARLNDIRDEIHVAFGDYIPPKDEWIKVPAYATTMDIVCRVSNRMLVGLPLCRDPDWIALNKEFTIDIVKASFVLRFLPAGLRSFVAPLFPNIQNGIKRGTKHLEPLIRERLEQEAEHGKEWPERPNDVISWIFEATKREQRDMRHLVIAVLLINFAAIHTTSIAFTHVLYELATRPEYVQPLRDEVEEVIRQEGWTKPAVHKLRKLDSFVKETMRLSGFSVITMPRKVLKDFTFSNGMTVPAGCTLAVPFSVIHTDPENYTDPETFDGFRFEKMREQEGEGLKHQIVSLDLEYILFGHGRHACPGRFFVASELKFMLAHLLLNYDLKMANGRGRPANWVFGTTSMPDAKAEVMFRQRRQDTGMQM